MKLKIECLCSIEKDQLRMFHQYFLLESIEIQADINANKNRKKLG